MKKLIGLILSFFLCCALTCIGYFKDTPILACLSAIASAVLGSVISIIFEAIDSHGQGFHMWYQQLIEDTIRDAVRNAAWCSSDPVCIQSYGQGPESCNLAACHNCALLPETCCECGNRLLDRGTVVGTLDNKSIGFFAELLEQ